MNPLRSDSRTKSDYGEGFTLIEVVIAMTISALVLVIIGSGFQISARAYERVQEGLEEQHRARIVLTRLTHHLASVDLAMTKTLSESELFLGGTTQKLVLISHVSLLPQHRSLPALSMLQIDGQEDSQALVVQESIWINNPEQIDEQFEQSESAQVLLPGIENPAFAYLKHADQSDSWEAAWDPRNDEWEPRAIRLSFTWSPSQKPFTMVVALPVVPAEVEG